MLLTTSEDDNATLAKSIYNKPKNEVANKLPNGYVVCDWYSSLKQNSPENPSFFQISSLKFVVFIFSSPTNSKWTLSPFWL